MAVSAQLKGQKCPPPLHKALGQLAHEVALFLPCVLHRAAQRQHETFGFVGTPLFTSAEVDGDVRDDGQRLVPCDKAARRAHRVVRPDEGHTGKARRAVEQSQDRAAVGLNASERQQPPETSSGCGLMRMQGQSVCEAAMRNASARAER